MLDMVFQLVTFFMLVINFKTNQIDTQMDLPVVGSARPVKADGLLLLMVNINKKGQFTVFNKPFSDPQMEQYISSQAASDRLAARRTNRTSTRAMICRRLSSFGPIAARRLKNCITRLELCQANHYRNFVFRTAQHLTAGSRAAEKPSGI